MIDKVMNELKKVELEYIWGDALDELIRHYAAKGYNTSQIIKELLIDDAIIKEECEM